MVSNHKSGLIAERVAIWFLRLKGYRVLEHRYKTKLGEIDIIAAKNKTIHFIEVKRRPDELTALEAVNLKSQKRIQKTAELFLIKNKKFTNKNIYFDVIIILPKKIAGINIGLIPKHIINAWQI